MKDNQYKNGFSIMVLVVVACLLFLPKISLPENHPPGMLADTPLTITCPDDIVQGNDPGQCSAIVTYTIPAGLYLASGPSSGSSFTVGVTIIQLNLDDDSDSCTFTISVNDSEDPEFLFCPDDIISSYDEGLCQMIYFDDPEAMDNCELDTLFQQSGLPSGSIFPIGTTINTFLARDTAGNETLCSFSVSVTGNHTAVLESDGSNSQLMTPQGELRYQRAFYLITPAEMSSTDLETGMEVNSIGFTIGVAQAETTEGNLEVYLENTTDTLSRIDDAWQTATTTTNTMTLSISDPGEYEWKVKALCSGSSEYSGLATFDNGDLGSCNQPFNLETSSITSSAAIFAWELPDPSGVDSLMLIYGISLSDTQDTVYTTGMSYSATGLTQDTAYQWKVRTLCSSDDSPYAAESFSTLGPDVCEEPTSLTIGTVTDTTAEVSWTENTDSSHYELSARRLGTSYWINYYSFGDSYTLSGLEPGTTYEWKVRTICPDGEGSFVPGSNITTTGAVVCYIPEDLKTSNVSNTEVDLSWLAVPDATSYEVSYRLIESISWSNAIAGMTMVSNSGITIPDTLGPYDIAFQSGSTFTYDGNGVYIAWEYTNASGSVTTSNTSLCTKQNSALKAVSGLDSIPLIRSFIGQTDENSIALPATLRATNLRPETRLGSPALKDSVEVTAVYTLGYVALNYGSPVPISAMIKNFSDKERTFTATLEIFNRENDDLRMSVSQDITVDAACGEIVTFPDWMPGEYGVDSVVVSIPPQSGENVIDNNSNYYIQDVNQFMHAYDDDSPFINAAGFGNGDGLILSRYTMNGCGKVIAAKVYLHWSAANNPLFAVILDDGGNILNTSYGITVDSMNVNCYHSFYFPDPPSISNADYYIGLAQVANPTDAYYPVATQWESNLIREGAYYRADLDGSNLLDHPYPGRLMIQAEIIPAMPAPYISGDEILCQGNTNTLTAASRTSRYADSVISVSSQYSEYIFGAIQTLGTPDVWPEYEPDPRAWGSETADLQREYIEVHFPDPAPINYINIYQTQNPGAIDTVYIIKSDGSYDMVYGDTARPEVQEASIKEISFSLTAYDVSKIRIELGSDSVSGYNTIDAVVIGQNHDPATFSSYSWDPGGETSQTIDVTTEGTYKLTATNASGCSMTDSIEINTPVITTPLISFSGPSEFCEGDSVTLYSSESGDNSWSTGEEGDSITVSTSGTYNVTYDNGCESATSSDVVVTSLPLPQVVLTGGAMCPGSSTIISAAAGFESYLWSTGDSTQSITVSIPNYYEVTVTDTNACEGSGSVSSFYAPAPVPAISGDPFFCPGDSTLLDAGWGYSSYLWSTGDTVRKIYVSTTGAVSVTVTNEHGCSGTTGVTTGEYVPPAPFISGALSLCYGSATILDAGEGYASYLWSTGEITSSIVVDTADTFTVTVTDAHGCEGSASATTNMDGALPDIPGPISGPTGGICQQSGLIYTIDPVLNSTHYVWTVPDGMSITDGQGTTEITVDAGIISTGIITVAASNTCGQSHTWNGRTLEVHGTPDAPGEIAGQANGVCGLSGLAYSVVEIYGASSYNWTVPVGAVITSGSGTSSITVSFDPSFITGYICVGTTNSCGTSEDACLMISSKPAMPTEIFGPIEVCRKAKNVAYAIDPVFNVDNYIWTVPLQAKIKSGQGTPGITVDFGNKAGYVRVQTENDCGLSSIQSLAVDVVPCDDDGLVINISDPPNNGMNNNDPVINGSKHIFFPEVIASAGGFNYGEMTTLSWTLGESVIETVSDDRMMLSQGFHQNYYEIIALGGIPDGSTFEVEVYPVPTRDNVHIHITSDSETVNLMVELYDLVGNVVYKENVTSREFNYQINLYQYPANLFVLKVTDNETNYERMFKIIKVKL
ncbi:MAG: HYR domain-containing protein [Bacteroidota bacterium]